MFQKLKIVVPVFFLLFFISCIFFTSIYLNLFKTSFQKILSSKFNVNKIEYKNISGNFINGFQIEELIINTEDYFALSRQVKLDINLSDAFNGFSDIDSIIFFDSILELKKDYLDYFDSIETSNNWTINFIALNNLKIEKNTDNVFFDNLNIAFDKDGYVINAKGEGKLLDYSLDIDRVGAKIYSNYKEFDFTDLEIEYTNNTLFFNNFNISFDSYNNYIMSGIGNGNVLGYNLNIDSLNIVPYQKEHKYYLDIGSLNDNIFGFNQLTLYGDFIDLDYFKGDFDIYSPNLFQKDFHHINGKIEYLDSIFTIDVPFVSKVEEKQKKHILSGYIEIQDTLVNLRKVQLKTRGYPSLLLNNQLIYANQHYFYGKDISVDYKVGNLFINDFKVESSAEYFFDMTFDNFDIDLFKGLDANGYLNGDLYFANNDSAYFSNAKIEDFSYKKYSFDEVDLEGSFNNDELVISDLKFSKQIGFLNVTGSFTSLDNFYNKIINKIKVRIKD